MPNFKFQRDSKIVRAIENQANALARKLVAFEVPDFPLTADRIEALLNPPEIMRAVNELRSMSFAQFQVLNTINIAFDNIGVDRPVSASFTVPGIISVRGDGNIFFAKDWAQTVKAALHLDARRLKDDERDALAAWTHAAAKARQRQSLIIKTVKNFILDYATCSYDVSVSWPGIGMLVPDKHGEWRARFQEKPRTPADYDLSRHNPVIWREKAMAKRIEAVDVLLLKARFLPDRPRGGVPFDIHNWQIKPGDPAWLTY